MSVFLEVVGMRIYAIATESKPTPPTHAVVFVNEDEGWGITSDGEDGVQLHSVADPRGIEKWLKDLIGDSDKGDAWRKWCIEGEKNGWLDQVRNPDPNA